jgi:glycosyltransferase involved in cell wall biosynthesis
MPHSGCRLICIGRLDSYKRVDWAIEALVEAQRQLDHAGVQLHLDVVGEGPRRRELERLAACQVPGRVRFHGRLEDVAKWDLLHRADVLLLPADRSNEAFGIVQLEAMCLGTPAVALAHQRSGTAWVSQLPSLPGPWQRSDLPQLMTRLALEPQWREQLRLEARQRYVDTFGRPVWHQHLCDAFS